MELSCSVGAEKSLFKNIQLKGFIDAINDYLRSRSENDAMIVKKCLQAYSARIDVNIFDPETELGSQFYVCLYQLMSSLEPHSQILWDCVELLTNISRNCSARRVLIDTYQYILPLSRLVGDQLSSDKQKTLLRLLQDLTCGIKLTWQFPHLSNLLRTLTKWIECKDNEIVCLSLGVLVNLCYKNLPAIYTLSRTVDVKKLLRYCLPLQGPLIEVHVCKLMIIIDNTQDEIPRKTLLNLIKTTFVSIVEALTKSDPVMLRIVIDFFIDVLTKENIEFFREYKHYNEHIDRIVQLISARTNNPDLNLTPIEQSEAECVSLIIKLIYTLKVKDIGDLTSLYARIMKLALDWVHSEKVSNHALSLLTIVAQNSSKLDDGGGDKDILGLLTLKLSEFLDMLQSDAVPTDIDACKRLQSLLELFRVMLKCTYTSAELLHRIDEPLLRKIFDPILEGGAINIPRLHFGADSTTSTAAVDAYVQALGFVYELAQHDAKWLEFVDMLMENRCIHSILAQALYGSSSNVKQLVLEICKYPRFPMEKVALALETSQDLFCTSKQSSSAQETFSSESNYPIMTVAQAEILDEMLENFKKTVEGKDPSEISYKEVMELYEYKMTSTAHAESYALASAKAAAERCVHLQHRLAQLTSELNQLRGLLNRSESCMEQTKKIMKEQQAIYKEKRRKGDDELEKREKAISDLEAKLESTNIELAQMTELKKILEEHNAKKEQIIQKLQENGNKMEKQLQKREEQIKNANVHIDSLNMQNQDLRKHLDQKDIKLTEITKLYNASKDIINTITKVATSQLP